MNTETDEKYVPCYRCGISMGLFYDSARVFCTDCDSPDLIGVFRMLDYSYIFEGAA